VRLFYCARPDENKDDAMETREEMVAKRQAQLDAAKAIYDLAESESSELTPDQESAAVAHLDKADTIQADIEAHDTREATKARMQTASQWASQPASKPKPAALNPVVPPGDTPGQASQPNVVGGEAAGEFAHFGDFLSCVADAAQSPATADQRLFAAAPGMQTKVDSDGGFLIPVEQSNELIRRVYELGQILSRVRRVPLSGNTLTIPYVDETSRATGSRLGGVRGYWVEEAGSITDSQMTFGRLELKLKKAGAVGYVTEEMAMDYAASGSILMDSFAEELTFIVEDSIIRGTGAGQPQGILGSNSLVTVTKATNQTADTIWGDNLTAMWARMWARSRPNSVWYYNQDCEPQLSSATATGRFGSESTSVTGLPMFVPSGSIFNNTPFATIFGRPAIPVEYCSTLGDVGDLILMDPTQYLFADKGGMQTASSIHVRFLTDEQTFRVTWRVDGQPMWNSALTPFKGSATLSPNVVLEARS